MATTHSYYSNPAFCQQSEFANGRPGNTRQSPLGALNPPRVLDPNKNPEEEVLEEQEFYEEVVVDDKGFITDKKFVVVAQNTEGKKYIQNPQPNEKTASRYGTLHPTEDNRFGNRYASTSTNLEHTRYGSRYASTNLEDSRYGSRYGPLRVGTRYEVPPAVARTKDVKLSRSQSQRYEYIQMKEQDSWTSTPKKIRCQDDQEIIAPARVHRYAVIDPEEESELSAGAGRYALVPVEQLNQMMPKQPQKPRYEYIQDTHKTADVRNPSRYEYIHTTPPKTQPVLEFPQTPKGGNPIATQKLHEFLSTPKKTPAAPIRALSPSSDRKLIHPQFSPISKMPAQQRSRTTPPKAQQKLNYALGTRQMVPQEKRHTAIVAPICSSPIQSVYSETTFSNKSGSWTNLKGKRTPVETTLSVAATMMFLCGSVTSGLCFYMIKEMGRVYFLDFGVVSGFTCLILGLLGYRTRNVYWLPNRNYISGKLYIFVNVYLYRVGVWKHLICS